MKYSLIQRRKHVLDHDAGYTTHTRQRELVYDHTDQGRTINTTDDDVSALKYLYLEVDHQVGMDGLDYPRYRLYYAIMCQRHNAT